MELAPWQKKTDHLGLRGRVLDTKFGSKYGVTKPFVPTRIRHDFSAGTFVAGLIPPPQHTSCSPKVISASATITNLLQRARMPWIMEHPCDACLWDVPNEKSILLWHSLARLGRWRIFLRFWITVKRTLFLGGNVDSRDAHRTARRCLGTGGRCGVSGHTRSSRDFRCTLRESLFKWPRPPSPSFSRACHGSHHERTSIPENTSLERNDPALACGSEPAVDAVCTASCTLVISAEQNDKQAARHRVALQHCSCFWLSGFRRKRRDYASRQTGTSKLTAQHTMRKHHTSSRLRRRNKSSHRSSPAASCRREESASSHSSNTPTSQPAPRRHFAGA